MGVTTTATELAPYVIGVRVDDLFIDDAYQRPLDVPRARKMADNWDPRLAGIIEVSDRGDYPDAARYAVIDGHHRWGAAQLLDPPPLLVANVHSGLTVADEAKLFYDIAVGRRQLMTWDRWHARRGSGDPEVLAIEECAARCGLIVSERPIDGNVRCTATMEKIVALGGIDLLEDTLSLAATIWGRRLDAFDAPIVHGLAFVLHYLDEQIQSQRLAEALVDVHPRQVKARATALRETTSGSLGRLVALTIVGFYNGKPGKKVNATAKTFAGGVARNAHSAPAAAEVAS